MNSHLLKSPSSSFPRIVLLLLLLSTTLFDQFRGFNFFNSLSLNPADFFQNPFPKGNLKSAFKNLNSRLDDRIKLMNNMFKNHKEAVRRDYSNGIFNQIALGIRPKKV